MKSIVRYRVPTWLYRLGISYLLMYVAVEMAPQGEADVELIHFGVLFLTVSFVAISLWAATELVGSRSAESDQEAREADPGGGG